MLNLEMGLDATLKLLFWQGYVFIHFIIDLLMESRPIIGQYQFEVFTKTFTLSLLIIVG